MPCHQTPQAMTCQGLCVAVSAPENCCLPGVNGDETCEGVLEVRKKYSCDLEPNGWYNSGTQGQCCYQNCVAGRPLRIDHVMTLSGRHRRSDWG